MSRFDQFIDQVLKLKSLGLLPQDAGALSGPILNAWASAFDNLGRTRDAEMPNFDDMRYGRPCVVYHITNSNNGRVYVGKTAQSFLDRYKGGAWWVNHVNPYLSADALLHGIAAFHVSVFPCENEKELADLEASELSRLRHRSYNIRPEAI